MSGCHEIGSFVLGVGIHTIFDLIAIPIVAAIGWKAHGVAHANCGHGAVAWVRQWIAAKFRRNPDARPGHSSCGCSEHAPHTHHQRGIGPKKV